MIGVLIAVLQDAPAGTVSLEIGKLRKYVRKYHTDIRANGQVIATLWDFIERAGGGGDRERRVKKRRRVEGYDEADYLPPASLRKRV